MANRTKKKVLTAQLPPTPCIPEMRDQVVELAAKKGWSLAEVQRNAIALFLSNFVSSTNETVGISETDDAL